MSETKVSELWDNAIETGLKRIGYGLLAGSGVALVLARSNIIRAGIIGVTVGVGVGMTYAETQSQFELLAAKPEDSAPLETKS